MEHAQRAVACKHWRWMPGMLVRYPTGYSERIEDDMLPGEIQISVPDLSDPATLGCLLALVREAWEDPCICTAVDNTGAGWWVDGWQSSHDLHPTEAAALVAALEAAP